MSNQKPSFDIVPEEEREDRYHYYTDDKGRLLKTDIQTGEVVSAAPDFEKGLVPGNQIAPQFIKGNSKYWHYNQIYRDLICNHVASGKTLTEVSKMRGFPSLSLMAQWRAKNEDFEIGLKAAKRMAAEGYADRIKESLEETKDLSKDEVPAQKLYYEKLKWLAEKNDPEQYGNKNKVVGDGNSSMTLIVNTGITREKPVKVDNIIEGECHESN